MLVLDCGFVFEDVEESPEDSWRQRDKEFPVAEPRVLVPLLIRRPTQAMPASQPEQRSSSSPAGLDYFATTHWSVVLRAGRGDPPAANEALEILCRAYWYPLYAYVRRQGHSSHDAQDLTQEFFARLLARKDLAEVHPNRGKFRSFLLASLKHFLANEWDRAKALKRGGGQSILPIDIESGESRYSAEPSHDLTPQKYFEQRWALALLERVLERLREEQAHAGKAEHFDILKETLTTSRSSVVYAELATKLSLSEGAVKVAVHRLRRRYRELLRAEIAHTVSRPEEIDGEIRYLFAALNP